MRGRSTSIPKASSAASSFSPPRDTKRGPRYGWNARSGATDSPGLRSSRAAVALPDQQLARQQQPRRFVAVRRPDRARRSGRPAAISGIVSQPRAKYRPGAMTHGTPPARSVTAFKCPPSADVRAAQPRYVSGSAHPPRFMHRSGQCPGRLSGSMNAPTAAALGTGRLIGHTNPWFSASAVRRDVRRWLPPPAVRAPG